MLQHSVADALVRALRVVVLDMLAKGPPEGRLAGEDDPAQALLLDRAHEPRSRAIAVVDVGLLDPAPQDARVQVELPGHLAQVPALSSSTHEPKTGALTELV